MCETVELEEPGHNSTHIKAIINSEIRLIYLKFSHQVQKWYELKLKHESGPIFAKKSPKKNPTISDVFFGFPTFFSVFRRNPTKSDARFLQLRTSQKKIRRFPTFFWFSDEIRRNPTQGFYSFWFSDEIRRRVFTVTDPQDH